MFSKKIIMLIAKSFCCIVLLFLVACGTGNKVVGRWYSVDPVYLELYRCECSSQIEFEDDSEFTEKYFDVLTGSCVRTDKGKWELEDGNVILYKDEVQYPSKLIFEGSKLKSGDWTWEKK